MRGWLLRVCSFALMNAIDGKCRSVSDNVSNFSPKRNDQQLTVVMPRNVSNHASRRVRRPWSARIAVVLCFALISASAQENPEPLRPYVFGVFPYLPPLELESVFAPIAADFKRVLGRDVQFVSKTSYESFSRNLLDEQTYDIAFVQPFDYVLAADHSGYLPLAARPEKLYALLVTTENSPIRSIADLKGKRISLPPRDAAISRLIRVYFPSQG